MRGVWQERGGTARLDCRKTSTISCQENGQLKDPCVHSQQVCCVTDGTHLWLTGGLNHGNRWEFYNIAKPVGYLFEQWLLQLQHSVCPTPEKIQVWEKSIFGRSGQGGLLPSPMPAPRKFLVASTSLPLALGWGWNLSLYVGMLLGLLVLMLLLLWMLLKQLRNSVGKSTLQPVRSFRQPHFEHRLQHLLWKMGQFCHKHCQDWGLLECLSVPLQGSCKKMTLKNYLFCSQVLIIPHKIIKSVHVLIYRNHCLFF